MKRMKKRRKMREKLEEEVKIRDGREKIDGGEKKER